MEENFTPDIRSYDIILINTSAGKDSQAMLDYVVELATAAGVRDRVVAVHCDLGRAEWQGTRALAAEQCAHYGVPLHVVRRPQGDLLVQIEARGMWPDSGNRYCTSDQKRGQVEVLMTRLARECGAQGRAPRILNCMGLRAEESPARSKRAPFTLNKRATNSRKHVDEWLPIHAWTEAEVWERIRQSGVRHHWAYDVGMPRLSCVFCIFAPREALIIAGHHNPELLATYVAMEARMGHTFRHKFALAEVAEAVARGEMPARSSYKWAQCA